MTEPKRDIRWAREKLMEFREVVQNHREVSRAWQSERATDDAYYESLRAATTLQPIAWKIIASVIPDAQSPKSLRYGTEGEFIEYVNQVIGILDGNADLEEHWPSEYEVALDTSNLHPRTASTTELPNV